MHQACCVFACMLPCLFVYVHMCVSQISFDECSWPGFIYRSVHFQGVNSQSQKMVHPLADLMNKSESVIMAQLWSVRQPLEECGSTAQPEIGIIIRAVRGNDTLQMRRLQIAFTFIIIYITDVFLPKRLTQQSGFQSVFSILVHSIKVTHFLLFKIRVSELPQNFLLSPKKH